jgi:hypothetical protein
MDKFACPNNPYVTGPNEKDRAPGNLGYFRLLRLYRGFDAPEHEPKTLFDRGCLASFPPTTEPGDQQPGMAAALTINTFAINFN